MSWVVIVFNLSLTQQMNSRMQDLMSLLDGKEFYVLKKFHYDITSPKIRFHHTYCTDTHSDQFMLNNKIFRIVISLLNYWKLRKLIQLLSYAYLWRDLLFKSAYDIGFIGINHYICLMWRYHRWYLDNNCHKWKLLNINFRVCMMRYSIWLFMIFWQSSWFFDMKTFYCAFMMNKFDEIFL